MENTMQKVEQIDLIKGDFTAGEAKEILMNLINSKINFHEVKSFSKMIRLGIPEEQSLKRVEELKASRETILELLSSLDSDEEISLVSRVEIKIKK